MVIDVVIGQLNEGVDKYIRKYSFPVSIIIIPAYLKYLKLEAFRGIHIIYSVRATEIEVY